MRPCRGCRRQLTTTSAALSGGDDRAVSRSGEPVSLERRCRRSSPLAVERRGDGGCASDPNMSGKLDPGMVRQHSGKYKTERLPEWSRNETQTNRVQNIIVVIVLVVVAVSPRALRWCLTVGLYVLLCTTCSTGDPDRYSQVKETHNGTYLSQYEWRVRDMYALLQRSSVMHGVNLAGPDFYTGKPGYRVRLGLSFGRINPSNGIPYMGVWFTILRGRYDDSLEWPFQYRFNITVVDPSGSGQDAHVSMNPMTAICRLRKQFQRPTERRNDGVEGCGKSFLIPHSKLLGYVSDDSLLVRLSIFLEDKGAIPKRAKAYMRGHQLVSEFQWAVDDIDAKIKQARKGELQPLTSDLFYINSESYLMVLQLTFHSEDEHLGLFAVVIPGEFDDSLEWPLSYSFELSIVDQSAGFLTADRKGVIDPTSGVCPLSAFTKPQFQPNTPCGFRKLVSFSALERSNFKKDGKILLRFTAILDQMPNFASVSVKDRHLVAEYVWKVPSVERKIALATSGRPSNLLSERFYTRHQGYLMQMQLKFQNYTNGSIGVFLTLLEGGYDSLAQWPFVKRFDLIIIDQQHGKRGNDVVVAVDPNNPYIKNEACVGSFWRPFGRNDACGSSSAISYDEVYSRKYIRYGSLLVKYLWELKDAPAKVNLLKNGGFAKVESPIFYTANQGYALRMSLVLNRVTTPLQTLASNDDQSVLGIYFTLWKGRHDAVLRWPFPHVITLAVVDTVSGRADLSKTVDPTHARCPLEAFHRPKTMRNDHACGFSAFMAVERLGDYIRDGSLVIRATIDMRS
ncbi:hypothetical protein HPB50_012625 [Hyalomma asiaticum]|uniref:Uncharacterized protein n=1 Tax=Hyalomma asiaticum TaxID=266040 RepID=A0ACB7S729_HYAAI|nr:hypothetical protein HPB50_012625 [Hyalomma asiaticum]